MKISAPNCSVTGSQASVQMKLSPKFWIAGQARSKTFQAISPRSAAAASAAAMAIPLKSDVSQTNALTPEIGLRRQGLIRRRRHGRRARAYVPAWIFLISRYTKPFTEAGIGTKKSGGPNFWPAVTAQ